GLGGAGKPCREAVHPAGPRRRPDPGSIVDCPQCHAGGAGAGLPRRRVDRRTARPETVRRGPRGVAMTWLAWRLHRRQLLFAAIALGLLAAALVVTGQRIHHAFTGTGLARCLAVMQPVADYRQVDPVLGLPDCHAPAERFTAEFDGYFQPAVLLLVLPMLV